MTQTMNKRSSAIAVGAVGALALASTASAGVAPNLEFDLVASDGSNLSQMLSGGVVGSDLFQYAGTINDVDGDWTLNYDSLASSNPYDVTGAFVNNNLTLTNTSDSDLTFMITVTLGLDPMIDTDGSTYGGSVGVTLNGFDGLLTTDSSIYTALIDGSSIGTLLDNPFSLGFNGAGTADGNEVFGGTTDADVSTIGIALNFTLSPGDSLDTSNVFGIGAIPAPGAMGLAALGVFGAGRRRRRG